MTGKEASIHYEKLSKFFEPDQWSWIQFTSQILRKITICDTC